MMNAVIKRWQGLSHREKTILVWGGTGLLLIGYYGLILNPLLQEKALLTNRLNTEKMLFTKTKHQVQNIFDLGLVQKRHLTQDMNVFIRKLSANHNLLVNNIKTLPNHTWELSFESVNAKDFFSWLDALQQVGIVIVQFSIIKDEESSVITVENLKISKR